MKKYIIAVLLYTFTSVINGYGYDFLGLWMEPNEICDNNGRNYDNLCAFATAQKETCGSKNESHLFQCPSVERKDVYLKRLEMRLTKTQVKEFRKYLMERINKRKEYLQKRTKDRLIKLADSKAKIEARRNEIAKSFKVCGIDSTGVEKTYDNMCLFTFEKACQKVKVVHPGTCGDCSDENVCPSWEEFEVKTTEKARKKDRGKKSKNVLSTLCYTIGTQYNKCAFKVARCIAFQKDKSLPLLEWKKCTKKLKIN